MNVRPEKEDVFLTSAHVLRPDREFLDSAAYVSLVRGQQSAQLPWAIKQAMVQTHGGRIEQYDVYKINDTEYMLVCVNEQTLAAVVRHGPYDLPAGVRITLTKWTRTSGMSYTPNRYEAWIKLIGLPYHLWNDEELRKVLARVGKIRYTMPYGRHSGQFEHIVVQIDTKHPSNISRFLRVRVGDFSRRVRVQLLGWREGHEGYFPPPVPPNQTQPSRIRYTPYQQAHRRRPSPPTDISEESGNSNISGGGSNWATGVRGKINSNKPRGLKRKNTTKIRVQPKPIWKPKKRVKNTHAKEKRWMRKKRLTSTPKGSSVAITRPTETPKVTKFSLSLGPKEIGVVLLVWGKEIISRIVHQPYKELSLLRGFVGYNPSTYAKWLNVLQGTKVNFSAKFEMSIKNSTETQLFTPKTQLLEIEFGPTGLYGPAANRPLIGSAANRPLIGSKANELQLQQGPQIGSEFYEDISGPHKEFNTVPKEMGGATAGPQEEEEFGPPPGFENFLLGKEIPTGEVIARELEGDQFRRSPRLLKKNNGPYVAAVDKARRLKEKQQFTTPSKVGQQGKQYKQTDLSCMQTLDPLSDTQAGLVVATAGIEINEAMEEKLSSLSITEPAAQH